MPPFRKVYLSELALPSAKWKIQYLKLAPGVATIKIGKRKEKKNEAMQAMAFFVGRRRHGDLDDDDVSNGVGSRKGRWATWGDCGE